MKKEPEIVTTPNPNEWTEKQLSTMRHYCVQMAVEVYKSNLHTNLFGLADDICNFIKDGKLPKAGGWK